MGRPSSDGHGRVTTFEVRKPVRAEGGPVRRGAGRRPSHDDLPRGLGLRCRRVRFWSLPDCLRPRHRRQQHPDRDHGSHSLRNAAGAGPGGPGGRAPSCAEVDCGGRLLRGLCELGIGGPDPIRPVRSSCGRRIASPSPDRGKRRGHRLREHQLGWLAARPRPRVSDGRLLRPTSPDGDHSGGGLQHSGSPLHRLLERQRPRRERRLRLHDSYSVRGGPAGLALGGVHSPHPGAADGPHGWPAAAHVGDPGSSVHRRRLPTPDQLHVPVELRGLSCRSVLRGVHAASPGTAALPRGGADPDQPDCQRAVSASLGADG